MYNPQDDEAQRFADWKAKREPQPQSQPQQTSDIQDDEAQRFADWKAKRKSTQARDNLVQNSYKFGNETVDSFIEDNLLRNDFALGSARNLLDYGASITKGVGKIGGKIGFDGFEQKAQRVSKRFNDKSHDVQDSIDNQWIGIAGEMLGDPLNLTPAGIITKGTKAKRVAKSMLAGAGVGAGTMALKNYGDERLTQEQKNLEMGIGAGFVSAINGIIAGVTKGRVDGISPSALKNPDGTIKNDDDIANALMNEPEAFGLNKNEAEVITDEIVKHKQQKVLPQYAKETPFPKKPQESNFQMRPNHPPAPMTRERALDVIFRKANQEAIAKGDQPIYPTVATDYEAHPRFNELIDMRRNVTAQQSQSPQVLDTRGGYREVSGNGGENKHAYDFPTYNQNHNYDFYLTKNDIKNIETGRIDDDLRWKIKEDLNTMDNHPDWKKQSIDDIEMTDADWQEANAVFAKGADNLAVGAYAGIEQDEQGNISFDPEKFIIGLGGYTAVKTALKNKQVQGKLKEYAQRAVDAVDMNPQVHKENGLNAMFVGAKGDEKGAFSDVATKQTMREIDDSQINYKPIPKQKVEMDGVEYEQNYANLGEIIDHPDLFKKYPELKDVQVSINNRGGRGGSYNAGMNAIALDGGSVGKVVGDEEQAIRLQIRELDANPIDADYARLNEKLIDEATPPEQLVTIDKEIQATPTAQKIQELNTQLYKAMDNADASAKGARVLNGDGKSTLLHEIQHAIQETEGWAKGGSIDNMPSIAEHFIKNSEARLNELESVPEDSLSGKEKWELVSLQRQREKAIQELEEYNGDVKYNKYMRLWGEQQARATQYRKDMTPEERMTESPYDTLMRVEGEVKDPIVKYDGVSEMSSTRAEKIINKLKDEIDYKKLPKERQDIYDVYVGNRSVAEIKSHDLDDILELAHGSRKQGARKIIAIHGGEDAKGGLTPSELVEVGEALRNGKIMDNSFTETDKSIRYAYNYKKDDVNLRVVVEEFNDGKKVFDYYSDRNFIDYSKGAEPKQQPHRTTPNETSIPQEAEKIKSTFDKNNPDMLMANGQTSLAGGFAGGADATINQRDYDGDGEFTAKDLAYGAGAGVAGIHTLKKVAPKMFVDDAGEGGFKAGLFAGTKAKGYDAKAKARKTFNGKYDSIERFEINDSMSKLKNISDFVKSGETVRLDDVLEHKELFYNYPGLKEIPIKFKKGEGSSFSKDGIEIGVDGFKSADDFKSALLHEVQHSLQKKEGFARGGSASEFYTDSKKKIDLLKYENEFEVDDFARDRRFKQIEQLEQKFADGGKEEAFEMYQKLAGEIEARDVQARMDYTAPKRDEVAPYSSEDIAPEDAVLRFNNANDDLIRDLKQMSETGSKKKEEKGIFKNSLDTLEELSLNKDKKEWGDISKDNSTFKNVTNSMKELFTDTFNAKYHEARDLTHSNMQTKNLEVERLAKILGDLDEATDKELYRYLTGQDSTLPDGMKAVANKMRKTIDDLGAELVRNGVLEERAFKEWAGVYLHRNYEPTMNPKGIFKKGFKIDKIHERGDSKTFTKNDVKGALGWLNKSGYIDFGEMGKIGNMRQLREYLNSSQKAGMLKEGKVSITEQPDGKIKFRRDWTKTEREAMGELESAKYAVPETIMKLNRMTEHARFLKRAEGVKGVVLDGKMAKEMSHAEIERAGYVKLDGVSFGALNGKYVRADVADDVGRIYKDISNTHSDAFRVWNEYHGLWKKSKTVWNPTAHVNNYMGNLFLMHLGGVNSAKIPSLLKRGAQSMKSYKKFEDLEIKRLKGSLTNNEKLQYIKMKEQSKLVQEAKENGVFGRSQLNDILAGMENTVAKKGILSKIDRATEQAYQFEDDFNRLSFYLTLRESGRDPNTSKKMIDFMLPDYSRPLPKGWRVLRDTSIAPFISWSYYTMPSIVKMLGTKEGAKNATKVIGALSAMEYVMTQGDITPLDNVPFMDGKKPEDFKGRRFAYGKNGDKIDTIKMDRMIPYAELQNPINYAKSNFSGMLPNAFYSMNGMQMYNGRPITYKNKDLGDKSIDWVKHLAGQYTPVPAPAMSGIGVADKAMRSKESRRRSKVIEPRTMPQSLMQILGLNTMTYSKDGLRKEQRD